MKVTTLDSRSPFEALTDADYLLRKLTEQIGHVANTWLLECAALNQPFGAADVRRLGRAREAIIDHLDVVEDLLDAVGLRAERVVWIERPACREEAGVTSEIWLYAETIVRPASPPPERAGVCVFAESRRVIGRWADSLLAPQQTHQRTAFRAIHVLQHHLKRWREVRDAVGDLLREATPPHCLQKVDQGGAAEQTAKNAGGRPPNLSKHERYQAILDLVPVFDNLPKAVDAYNQQYGTKCKVGAIRKWKTRRDTATRTALAAHQLTLSDPTQKAA